MEYQAQWTRLVRELGVADARDAMSDPGYIDALMGKVSLPDARDAGWDALLDAGPPPVKRKRVQPSARKPVDSARKPVDPVGTVSMVPPVREEFSVLDEATGVENPFWVRVVCDCRDDERTRQIAKFVADVTAAGALVWADNGAVGQRSRRGTDVGIWRGTDTVTRTMKCPVCRTTVPLKLGRLELLLTLIAKTTYAEDKSRGTTVTLKLLQHMARMTDWHKAAKDTYNEGWLNSNAYLEILRP